MAQSMKKEIRKTFGFAREKFSAKVRLDTKMPGVYNFAQVCSYLYIDTYMMMMVQYIHCYSHDFCQCLLCPKAHCTITDTISKVSKRLISEVLIAKPTPDCLLSLAERLSKRLCSQLQHQKAVLYQLNRSH